MMTFWLMIIPYIPHKGIVEENVMRGSRKSEELGNLWKR